jgi:hypothetical protein
MDESGRDISSGVGEGGGCVGRGVAVGKGVELEVGV